MISIKKKVVLDVLNVLAKFKYCRDVVFALNYIVRLPGSWRSVLLVEETRVSVKNHYNSHTFVPSTPRQRSESSSTLLDVISFLGRWKYNYMYHI